MSYTKQNERGIEIMSINIILERLESLKKKHSEDKGKKELILENIQKKSLEAKEIKNEINKNIVLREILHDSSEEARRKSKELLESVTSNAISLVTGENLEVKINLAIKNNTMNADLTLEAKYPGDIIVETNPAQEDAGGAADVVALSVFESIRMLSGKENVAPIFLDEPLKYVSAGNAKGSAEFVKGLTNMTGIQTFVVTHELNNLPNVADKAYKLELVDGNTKVQAL